MRHHPDVYNPFSLLNAFASQDIRDYWFSSGTPSYLVRLLSHTDDNLDEITGKYYDPREFIDYKATVEKPLPMIYQSGYLTITIPTTRLRRVSCRSLPPIISSPAPRA